MSKEWPWIPHLCNFSVAQIKNKGGTYNPSSIDGARDHYATRHLWSGSGDDAYTHTALHSHTFSRTVSALGTITISTCDEISFVLFYFSMFCLVYGCVGVIEEPKHWTSRVI